MKSKLIQQWNNGLEAMKIEQAKVDNIKALEDWAIKFKAMTDVVLQAHNFASSLARLKDYTPKHGKQIAGRGRPEQVVTVPVWKLDSMLEDIETLSCRNNHLKNALTDREKHIARQDSDNFKLRQDLTFAHMIISGNDFHELKEENIAMTGRISKLDAKLKKRTQSLNTYRDIVQKGKEALNESNKEVARLNKELETQKMLRVINQTPVGVKIEGNTVTIERNWIENFTVENDMTGCHVVDTVTYKMKEPRKPFCNK